MDEQPDTSEVQSDGRRLVIIVVLAALSVLGIDALVRGNPSSPAAEVEPRTVAAASFTPPAAPAVGSAPQEDPVVAPIETRWFNGRPVRPVREMPMRVTAYSPDARSCGSSADGITASGYSVWTNGMKLVAADTSVLPYGSLVSIPGYHDGQVVPVLDRGGRIKGNRLDVLYATHKRAMRWGVQRLNVTVWAYADGGRDDFRTRH